MTFDPKHFFELAKQLFDDLEYNEDARYLQILLFNAETIINDVDKLK